VARFRGAAPAADDETVLTLKRHAAGSLSRMTARPACKSSSPPQATRDICASFAAPSALWRR
jgi:hypothetical protein